MSEGNIIVVGSAHKVGSTWLYRLIADSLGLKTGGLPKHLNTGSDTLVLEHADAPEFLNGLAGRWIFKAHSFGDLGRFRGVRFLSIYRDPRDVVVSTAFYLSWLTVEQGGKGPGFSALPVQERLRTIIHDEYFLRKLEEWFHSPAHQTRYEDLVSDPGAALKSAFDYLGVQPRPKALRDSIRRNSFEAKSGRPMGKEDPKSFYRKGTIDDWKNHFDDPCVASFKSALGGRWNALLLEMGYESRADWTTK
jgi:hypothetical protein